jgi:hypothetical protein
MIEQHIGPAQATRLVMPQVEEGVEDGESGGLGGGTSLGGESPGLPRATRFGVSF